MMYLFQLLNLLLITGECANVEINNLIGFIKFDYRLCKCKSGPNPYPANT